MIEDSLAEKGMLSVCIREVQKTLRDSAKRLIERKLTDFRLGEADGFKIFADRIETPGDGLIIFQGMQDHTAESIKSLEGFKRAWAEEAQTLSARSLELLRPTLREAGSELWFGWNPRRKVDPVDAMLRGEERPSNAIVVEANWRDNPWFPPDLDMERKDCLRTAPGQYDHIWEGGYAKIVSGAYYAKELAEMVASARLGRVARDPLMTLRAIWDIGGTGQKADGRSIWICQFVAREIRVLDYRETRGQALSADVEWLRTSGYKSALCSLPHDGDTNDRVHDVSYRSYLEEAGFEVEVIENQGKGAALKRIEAARRLFPSIWVNEETTRPGIEALGAYHAKIDEQRQVDLGPEHDWASHAADAWGLMCVVYEKPVEKNTAWERKPQRWVA